ncbi:MAG: hypothetical protein LBF24_02220 [Puniceicoccales bacterium]|nr:hypothetical protein [Puniceicoccales bacterium]
MTVPHGLLPDEIADRRKVEREQTSDKASRAVGPLDAKVSDLKCVTACKSIVFCERVGKWLPLVSATLSLLSLACPPFAMVGVVLSVAVGFASLFLHILRWKFLRESRIFAFGPDQCIALAESLMGRMANAEEEKKIVIEEFCSLLQSHWRTTGQEFFENQKLVDLFLELLREQDGAALAVFASFPDDVRQFIENTYGIAQDALPHVPAASRPTNPIGKFFQWNSTYRTAQNCINGVIGCCLLGIALEVIRASCPSLAIIITILSGVASLTSARLCTIANWEVTRPSETEGRKQVGQAEKGVTTAERLGIRTAAFPAISRAECVEFFEVILKSVGDVVSSAAIPCALLIFGLEYSALALAEKELNAPRKEGDVVPPKAELSGANP